MAHVPKDWDKWTRRDALLLCRELWVFISRNPNLGKHMWPRWARNGGDVPECSYLCPACGFLRHQELSSCSACILNWTNGHCLDGEYIEWRKAMTSEERVRWAKAIVRLCDEALAKEELDGA